MKSVWSESENIHHFNKLQEDIRTDVLIIGGGMAGILCAWFLKQKGIDYVLVEAHQIGEGITKNTTAKITSQHGLIYDNLIKKAGISKAKQYLSANEAAVNQYRQLCKNIDCDFEEKPAFVYSTDHKEKIENEVAAVNKLGYQAEFINQIPIPIPICGAIKFEKEAQFSPIKFLSSISQNLNIYENTLIKSIRNGNAITENGVISAKKIIIATHFPFINAPGYYFLKMYQHRSYVIALENAPQVNGMYVDEKQNGMSFRNYQDLLLIGGGDHRTGKNGGGWDELRQFSHKAWPNANERYYWATQDCMTLDQVPYIGRYSKKTPNLFVATGFNKWGMTSSMVSAMILTDMVMDKQNEFCDVFSPDRSIFKKQLLINTFETAVNFVNFNTKRCSHLGCALKWNSREHTWDCPCHGSRFDKAGTVIDNPAMKEVKIDDKG